MSLSVEHLSVDIGGRRIVTGISLAAADGQFTGLLGPNGSGKSTILKTIYRVHKPAAGRVLLTAPTCWPCPPGTLPGGSRWWPRKRPANSTSPCARW